MNPKDESAIPLAEAQRTIMTMTGGGIIPTRSQYLDVVLQVLSRCDEPMDAADGERFWDEWGTEDENEDEELGITPLTRPVTWSNAARVIEEAVARPDEIVALAAELKRLRLAKR